MLNPKPETLSRFMLGAVEHTVGGLNSNSGSYTVDVGFRVWKFGV